MKKKYLLNLLIVILIGLFFTALLWPEKEKSAGPVHLKKETKQKPKKDIEFELPKLSSMNKDKKEWELSAKTITYDQAQEKAHADEITCIFFKPDKTPFITLKAKGADIDLIDKSLEFVGTVSAEANAGEIMEIQKMRWDGKEKKAFGTGPVKIKTKNADLSGNLLIITPGKNKWEIAGNVKIKVNQGLFKNENNIKKPRKNL